MSLPYLSRTRGMHLLPPPEAAPARRTAWPRRLPLRLSLPGTLAVELRALAAQTGLELTDLAVYAVREGLPRLQAEADGTRCSRC